MATLSELLHAVAVDYRLLAGEVGLGRDVRRILHAGELEDVNSALGDGDLVVYATRDAGAPPEYHERALLAMLGFRVSGVLTDVQPASTVCAAAEQSNTPLIVVSEMAPQALIRSLQHAATLRDSQMQHIQVQLRQDLSDLTRAGANRAMLLQRLVEITGKSVVFQGRTAISDEIRLASRQGIASNTLRAVISATQAAVEGWMRETADEVVIRVLYWEVPAHHVVRLVAPVRFSGWTQAAISLFARPDELTSRDRTALLLTARALATLDAEPVQDRLTTRLATRCFPIAAMSIRAPDSRLEAVADTVRQVLDLDTGGLLQAPQDVRVWLPYRSVDEWTHLVHQCHVELSSSLGTVSIGHAFQRSGKTDTRAAAMIHAAEAALVADRLFGPGHVSSYSEAQVARLMLERSDATDLSSIFERVLGELAIEDPRRENGLLRTLEVYCETFTTVTTAERLGIHRNTVLHRLKRIEEITATDLEDSATRLILQLGLLADRLLRKVDAASGKPASLAGYTLAR